MKTNIGLTAGLVFIAMVTGCAGQPAQQAANSPTPTASPLATPGGSQASPSSSPLPPTASCKAVPTMASEPLVLAESIDKQGVHTVSLDSLRDPTHPSALCTLSNMDQVTLVSPTEIGYVTYSTTDATGPSHIMKMSLTDMKPVVVSAVQGGVMASAWTADGSTVAYLIDSLAPNLGSGDANQLWIKEGSTAPKSITSLIPLFGRDVSVDDQILVRFSPDDKYLLMVDTYVAGAAPATPDQAVIQVHSMPGGALVWEPPTALGVSGGKFGSYITMAAWSHLGDRVYYRDQAGVHVWDPTGTVKSVAAGLVWYSPSVSPDDQQVAYALNMGAQPQIDIRNLTSSTVKLLTGIRSEPIMLSSGELIESHFTPNTGLGPPYLASGVYVLNLLTNVETPLLVNPNASNRVVDVWPR